jgi:4-methylaminobutanoate oxidase (formaldehyde-forming)
MLKPADVVVIGSGGLGAATAFYLAKRKAGTVVLIDRHEIGSQTSPRAAGMVSCMRKSELMTRLIKVAAAAIPSFAEETGQPLDWVHSGSLKVARRTEDAEVIEADIVRGRRLDLDVEQITLFEAHRLNPFFETEGVAAVMRVGDDMYFDPAQVAVGFARGAEARGVTLLPGTAVTSVRIGSGRVEAVETDKGDIATAVVVDAAGAWTRQVAAASGIHIPLVPTMHQLFVTEMVAGARADLPMVRIMDAAVYMRPCQGGFLWGVYEEEPTFFDMDELSPNFGIADLQLEADILWRAAEDVKAQLPILLKAKVREHRGGLPTMTADGHHIVGPVPGVKGFFALSGCNVAGLSISPALGDAVAAWITEGEPSLDLSAMSIARFGPEARSEDWLRKNAAWQYRHFYGAV